MVCFRFGRKMSLAVYLLIKAVGSVTAIFATNFATFAIGRLVTGIGSCGANLISYVMGKFTLLTLYIGL